VDIARPSDNIGPQVISHQVATSNLSVHFVGLKHDHDGFRKAASRLSSKPYCYKTKKDERISLSTSVVSHAFSAARSSPRVFVLRMLWSPSSEFLGRNPSAERTLNRAHHLKYPFGALEEKHQTLLNIAIIAIYYPASTKITTLAHHDLPIFREEPIRPS
jgi:hypothetical protein